MVIHNTQTVKLYEALQLQLHSVSRTAFFAFGFTLPSSTSGKKLHCQQLAGWLWASMNVLLNDGHEAWVGLKSWKTGKNQLTKWEHRSISHQNSRDSWVFIPQNMKDHRFLPSSSTVVKVEKQGRPGRTPWRRHHPPFWNQVKYQVQEKSKGHTTWLSNLKTIYINHYQSIFCESRNEHGDCLNNKLHQSNIENHTWLLRKHDLQPMLLIVGRR